MASVIVQKVCYNRPMDALVQSAINYMRETLGITALLDHWEGSRALPIFMQDLYDCYTVCILDRHFILLVDRGTGENTPASICKHVSLIRDRWGEDVMYVNSAVTFYNRRRLIDYKVPFVIPGNQLYLPDVGLDLREHFRKSRTKRRSFSPATQVVILYALANHCYAPLTSGQFVEKLGYTPMTLSRAFDELEHAGIGVGSVQGRERVLHLENHGRTLWETALPFLRSPVQRSVPVRFPILEVPVLEAGLTALSRYSMIAAPSRPVLAVSADEWRTMKSSADVEELAYDEADAGRLEIWRYSPRLLSTTGTVDHLSLFLSLRDSKDERVEAALDEMLASLQW